MPPTQMKSIVTHIGNIHSNLNPEVGIQKNATSTEVADADCEGSTLEHIIITQATEINELSTKIDDLHAAILLQKNEYTAALGTKEKAVTEAQNDLTNLRAQMSETTDTIKKFQAAQSAWLAEEQILQAKIREATAQELDFEMEIGELKSEIYSLQKELDKTEDMLEARDTTIAFHAEFRTAHKHCTSDREQATGQINMLSDEVERLRNILIEKNDNIDSRVQSLKLAKKNSTDCLEAARLEIRSLQSQLNEAQAKYEDSSRIATDNQSKLDKAMSTAATLTERLQAKGSIIRDLEAQLYAANKKVRKTSTQHPPPETMEKGGIGTDETLTDKDESTEGKGNGPTVNTTHGSTPTLNSTQSRDTASPPTEQGRQIPHSRITHRYPYNTQTNRDTNYLDKAKELGVTFYVSKNYQGTNPIENYTNKKKHKRQHPYQGTNSQRRETEWEPEHRNGQRWYPIDRQRDRQQNKHHRHRAPHQVTQQNHDSENTSEFLRYSESNDRRISNFENNTEDEFEGIKTLLWNMMESIENLNRAEAKQSFAEQKQLTCEKCDMTHFLCKCS